LKESPIAFSYYEVSTRKITTCVIARHHHQQLPPPFFRHHLRRMAIALVGIPSNDPTHPIHEWLIQEKKQEQEAEGGGDANNTVHTRGSTTDEESPLISTNDDDPSMTSTPLIPNIVLDEVVIHFRCGDIMASEELYFRFFKFREFASRISADVESIGIVTQPFGKQTLLESTRNHNSTNSGSGTVKNDGDDDNSNDQARFKDAEDGFRNYACRKVVLGFADYLQDRFPKARISIHNGSEETVALAYARLVMAKRQAFAYPDSSFSIFPVLATFGTGMHLYVPSQVALCRVRV
jgi:hypothetical protein